MTTKTHEMRVNDSQRSSRSTTRAASPRGSNNSESYIKFINKAKEIMTNQLKHKIKIPLLNLVEQVFSQNDGLYDGNWDSVQPISYYSNQQPDTDSTFKFLSLYMSGRLRKPQFKHNGQVYKIQHKALSTMF